MNAAASRAPAFGSPPSDAASTQVHSDAAQAATDTKPNVNAHAQSGTVLCPPPGAKAAPLATPVTIDVSWTSKNATSISVDLTGGAEHYENQPPKGTVSLY